MRIIEQETTERGILPGRKRDSSKTGLTVIEVLVMLAIVAVLFAMLLPVYHRSRAKQDWGSCIVHLKETGYAFRVWANHNNGNFPMQISVTNGGTMEILASEPASTLRVLSNELNTPTIVWCPYDLGKTRASRFSPDFSNSNVSYALNLSATPDDPTTLLASDRKIEVDGSQARAGILLTTNYGQTGWTKDIHGGIGNLIFVDGHSERGGSNVIQKALERLGTTNRFVIP